MNAEFYDRLAPYYHLLYGDWEAAIETQGRALASLLAEFGVVAGHRVLDAAAGIGTQAIGLAQCGYAVTASDISLGAIARLQQEFQKRDLAVSAHVDDLRSLARCESQSMAAILACDNSLPHLLSDADLLKALRACYRCIRPGGVAIFSVRDYATIERRNPDVRPYGLRRAGDSRFLAVQVWEWEDAQYDLRLYLTEEPARGECTTHVFCSRYYAVTVEHLLALMREAGFASVHRRDGVLFQPVLVGVREY